MDDITINQTATRAGTMFESGLYCAESVLTAMAEVLEISSELIPGIATGFCAGQARTCRQCGALSGAVMGLGLACGRESADEPVDMIFGDVQRLMSAFQTRFGSLDCRELIGLDLGKDADRERFLTENKREFCTDVTTETTRLALNILAERIGD